MIVARTSPPLLRPAALALLGGLLLAGLSACTPKVNPAPGCRPWDQQTGSTEPPTHCLFFPSGLAIDPLGDVLYVSNANTDRSFGGGTVAAIDALRHEHAVSCFRQPQRADCAPSLRCEAVTAALGSSPSLQAVLRYEADALARGEIKAAADLDRCFCEADLLDPSIVNCDSDRFILHEQTVKTGSFAGQIRLLAEDPADWTAAREGQTLRRGLYLAVREDPSVTFVEVSRPLRLSRAATTSPEVTLRCGPGREAGESITFCDDEHRVQHTPDEVYIDPDDPSQGVRYRYMVPAEPFGLSVDRGCLLPGYTHARGDFARDAQGNLLLDKPLCRSKAGDVRADLYYQYLVASHLSGADLSSYRLQGSGAQPGLPVLADVRLGLFPVDSLGRRGVYSASPRVQGDLSQPWYATGRQEGRIVTFRLRTSEVDALRTPEIVPGQVLSVLGKFAGFGQDVRELVFTPGGERAYVTVNIPPSVHILDTRPDVLTGVPPNEIIAGVDLLSRPYRMVWTRVPLHVPGQGARLQERLYISNYQDGKITVVEVDGSSLRLAETIVVGRGPFSLVLNHGGEAAGTAVDPCADPYVSETEAAARGVRCPASGALRPRPDPLTEPAPRGYVVTDVDNAIVVLDLDPRSAAFNRVVSRIGKPSPKQGQ
jgi:hypothetical protein